MLAISRTFVEFVLEEINNHVSERNVLERNFLGLWLFSFEHWDQTRRVKKQGVSLSFVVS
jgi:hypothetical protein